MFRRMCPSSFSLPFPRHPRKSSFPKSIFPLFLKQVAMRAFWIRRMAPGWHVSTLKAKHHEDHEGRIIQSKNWKKWSQFWVRSPPASFKIIFSRDHDHDDSMEQKQNHKKVSTKIGPWHLIATWHLQLSNQE